MLKTLLMCKHNHPLPENFIDFFNIIVVQQWPCVVCTLCEPVNDVLKLINVQQKIVVMKKFTKAKLKNKSWKWNGSN